MKVFLLISLLLSLYHCGDVGAYVASNTSIFVSDGTQLVKNLANIKEELDKLKQDRKHDEDTKHRVRRFSEISRGIGDIFDKGFSGIRSILKTYIQQPIANGNIKEIPIRLTTIWATGKGKIIFRSLNWPPNQSFKSLMKNRRTGDIIACKIPGNKLAEHYMMIIGDDIAEVSVNGGKKSTSNNGVLQKYSFRKSSYYDSDECLKHENRVIQTAEAIDDANRQNTETDAKTDEIIERFSATVDKLVASSTHRFNYNLLSCNCQDFVLYWTYGYVEHNKCIEQLFSEEKIPYKYKLDDLFKYIDRDGSARNDLSSDIILQAGPVG